LGAPLHVVHPGEAPLLLLLGPGPVAPAHPLWPPPPSPKPDVEHADGQRAAQASSCCWQARQLGVVFDRHRYAQSESPEAQAHAHA
jgi:hypothetical protein